MFDREKLYRQFKQLFSIKKMTNKLLNIKIGIITSNLYKNNKKSGNAETYRYFDFCFID
jgi:hypothetical protein